MIVCWTMNQTKKNHSKSAKTMSPICMGRGTALTSIVIRTCARSLTASEQPRYTAKIIPKTAVSSAQALAEAKTNRRITWVMTLHATTARQITQRTSSKYLSSLESNSVLFLQRKEGNYGCDSETTAFVGVTEFLRVCFCFPGSKQKIVSPA